MPIRTLKSFVYILMIPVLLFMPPLAGLLAFPIARGQVVGDFTITAFPGGVGVFSGDPREASSTVFTITLTSQSGFAGVIGLSATISPTLNNKATATFTPQSVSLSSGTSGMSGMNVSAAKNAPPANYTITVTGTSGTSSHSTSVIYCVFDSGNRPLKRCF